MNRIIFEDGILVSPAKVNINGTVYDVQPEEYSGNTPLTADLLNQMQELLVQGIYPVGCIYMTTDSANPSTIFGFGTWSLWGAGKVPVCVDTSDTDFNTVEKTGGEKNHTLTNNELPSNGFAETFNTSGAGYSLGNGGTPQLYTTGNKTVGNGQAHNNLQPYITCYYWKRIA